MRFLFAALFTLVLSAGQPTPQDCAGCHEVDLSKRPKAVHLALSCVQCHSDITKLPHADKPAPVKCATCHAGQAKAYAGSVHGIARKKGMTDAATCASCHGPAHEVTPKAEADSKIAKKNLADTCGSCHSNPEFLAKHKIPFAKPVEAYKHSVHGKAVARGEDSAPSCSDCHGYHDILASRDPKAAVNRENVTGTCGNCHSDVKSAYDESVHGKAVAAGFKGAPVCTDCHGEHAILAPAEAGSLVNASRVSTATCGRCHGDERISARYALSGDKVTAFEDSFHGLAMKGGQKTVANCASCHGVHNIRSASDPQSMVNPANLGNTCGKCHAGIGKTFVAGPVHVRYAGVGEHPSVKWIRIVYLFLIPMTIGFMLVHNGLDWLAKTRRNKHGHHTGERMPRMNMKFRIAHGMVVLSFVTLVITGFALKYPDTWWVKTFVTNTVFRAWAHRVAAVIMLLATGFHLIHLAFFKRDRVIIWELMPNWQDAKDILNMFKHNLGFKVERPTFGMFGYAEKMEYWAFMWGTVVMAVTGVLLWAENWSLSRFPKWVLDAATAAHWYEAILATLSILVWHWYLVIFDPDVYPMDTAWLTGDTSGDHLRETRPAYYAALKAKQEAKDDVKDDEPEGESH
ncbi:MAG TPA: cytochrome b/b6 domain-containing protein [Holophagaceae bacterium]|nr:cytochrome b/b6 domain-containing protein [Holophagaceae bacterium]